MSYQTRKSYPLDIRASRRAWKSAKCKSPTRWNSCRRLIKLSMIDSLNRSNPAITTATAFDASTTRLRIDQREAGSGSRDNDIINPVGSASCNCSTISRVCWYQQVGKTTVAGLSNPVERSHQGHWYKRQEVTPLAFQLRGLGDAFASTVYVVESRVNDGPIYAVLHLEVAQGRYRCLFDRYSDDTPVNASCAAPGN